MISRVKFKRLVYKIECKVFLLGCYIEYLLIEMSANTPNPANLYIASVKNYADYLLKHPEAMETLLELLNQRGHEYFGKHKYPYESIDLELFHETMKKNKKENPYFEILNKNQFLKVLQTEQSEDAEIFEDEASFSDSYRHAILLDISDITNPKLVDAPPALLSPTTDWIFTWEKIEELPASFPDGTVIAVHFDTEGAGVVFFPIPTVTSG